ncbi:hypothetical protein RB596_000644 [Gaeumannomyces avenae]
MFLKQIDLTTALRPSYLADEVLLCLQDNVGLYEGKYKLPKQQDGQVYLTSHRICYVDKAEPRKHSVALDLKDVERYEFYAGFLKSSAKITLVPKPSKRRSTLQPRSQAQSSSSPLRNGASPPASRPDGAARGGVAAPPATSTATWVCTICSFSNPVPSNFDPATANAHTPLPPCLACGIKPALTHVLKAAISNATSRPPLSVPLPLRPQAQTVVSHGYGDDTSNNSRGGSATTSSEEASFQCPRCTFLNHPSLMSCEICGAPLISQDVPAQLTAVEPRTESPGPFLTPVGNHPGVENPESVKLSFRGGGEKVFYERLKGSMTQRKWLLQDAPPIPRSMRSTGDGDAGSPSRSTPGADRVRTAGIAGLEKRGLEMRKNNEMVIGSAFEDLEALMASAKEIVALAETFARQVNNSGGAGSSEASRLLAESASQLGLVTTKDVVGGNSSESLYISELARNLAEFLTDDSRGILKRSGGIISLVDLWAMFNRARGGVELVSPMDLEKAVRQWEKLQLPVRLRTFKSSVMVAQGADRTDESTVKTILAWMKDLHEFPPDREVAWNWYEFGRGVTAQDAAERFGWSIGVAEEELEMAEERGVLCREEGIEGLKFWENFIDTGEGLSPAQLEAKEAKEAQAVMYRALKDTGLI